MPPHKCSRDKDLNDLTDLAKSLATKVKILLGMFTLMLVILGVITTQSVRASNKSSEAMHQVQKVDARIDVQEERWKWLKETLERLEKKVDKQHDNTGCNK